MRNGFAAMLCLIVLALPAHSASAIDGKWEARFPDPQGGQIAVVFDLSSNGTTVAGTLSNWSGAEQLHKVFVQNGKVQGNTVTFHIFHPIPFLFGKFMREWEAILWNWGSALNTVTGTVTGDTMDFTQRDWKGDTIQFQAMRVK